MSDADVRGVFGPWGNGLGEAEVARRTRVLASSDRRLDRDWDAQDSWLTHVQAADRDLRRLPADQGRVRSGHAGGDASQTTLAGVQSIGCTEVYANSKHWPCLFRSTRVGRHPVAVHTGLYLPRDRVPVHEGEHNLGGSTRKRCEARLVRRPEALSAPGGIRTHTGSVLSRTRKSASTTSCACLRRCPWPIIESRSQAGHRRKMTSAQLAAQSVSRLYGGTESGINRIVAHWSSVLRR